jgi:hypothetical protein
MRTGTSPKCVSPLQLEVDRLIVYCSKRKKIKTSLKLYMFIKEAKMNNLQVAVDLRIIHNIFIWF